MVQNAPLQKKQLFYPNIIMARKFEYLSCRVRYTDQKLPCRTIDFLLQTLHTLHLSVASLSRKIRKTLGKNPRTVSVKNAVNWFLLLLLARRRADLNWIRIRGEDEG